MRVLASENDVQRFLEDQNALESWLDFQTHFFQPLIKLLEADQQQWADEDKKQYIRVGELLRQFSRFIVADNFQQYLNDWRNSSEPLDWLVIQQKIRSEFEIDQFLQERNGVWEYDLNQKYQLLDRIKTLRELLASLVDPASATIDPEDASIVRETLAGLFPQIERVIDQIDDVLSRSTPDLALEEKTQRTLTEKLQKLDEDGRKAVLESINDTASLSGKKLGEALSEFKQVTVNGSKDETRNEIERIEQSQGLQNAPGKKGLVFAFLDYLRDRQIKEYEAVIVDFVLRMVVVYSVRGAKQDTLDTVEKLILCLEKLLELLTKESNALIAAANKSYDEQVQKILGVRQASDDSFTPDGGGDQPEEPSLLSTADLPTVIALWSAVAEAWKQSVEFIDRAEKKKQDEIFEILGRNSLRRETLESDDISWESIFSSYNDEQKTRSANDAQKLLYLLDTLDRKTEEPQEETEKFEEQQKPQEQSVVPLVTPVDGQAPATAEATEGNKFREIGKISRDKATLDAIVESRLREVLAENGLPAPEIERQIEQFRSAMSSELWLSMLQEGVLTGKLNFETIVQLQTQFVEKYSNLILQRPAVINLQLSQKRLLEFYATNPDINREDLELNFSPQKIQEVLAYARELNTPEKRWNAVFRFCQNELGYTPKKDYLEFFFRLTDGLSVVEAGFALDELTQKLYRRTWNQLPEEKQREILAEIDKFYSNIGIFGALFGLRDLVLLQGQINQVVQFAALQQEFISQLQAQGQNRSAQLFTSLSSYARETQDTAPTEVAQSSAATQAIEISTTLFIIQTLEITQDQRQVLEALAIERQLRGDAFGPAELGYIMAALRDEPTGFVDPNLQASLDPEVQKWRELQKDQAAFQEAHSGLHQQAAQQEAKSSGINAQRQRLQMAMKIAKAAAGGPAAWAALLADPNVRKALIKFISDPKKMGPALGIILAPPIAVGTIISNAIRDPLGTLGSILSPGGTSAASIGIPSGLSEGLAEGGTAVQAGLGKELGSSLAKAAESAASLGKSIPASISNGITNLGLGKSFALLAGASFIGPLGLAGIITIIVITVIGASLNDLPFGYIRTSFYDGVVCWPTNGTYERGDGPNHQTSPNGSAMDISGNIGEPIFSPFSGSVVRAPREMAKDGYGYYIDIKTDDGFNLIFAHMAAPSSLSVGDRVEAGTQVGEMGNTGKSTGPHLHYEIISTTLKITDIVPSQPPLVQGATISVDQCENFGTDAAGELIAVTAGGGGYAYVFNDGYEFVTQADLSATKHVGVFGQANQVEAAINGNLYTPAAGTIDGIYTNGAGNAGYSLQPRPMEIAALFLSVDSLPQATVNKLAVPSGNRVLYNQNGLVMLNIRGVGSSGDDEQVIREEILPLVEHAVSGVPPIMINGRAQDMSPYPDRDTTILRPRTIFGWSDGANGREYAFVVVRDATFWDLDNVASEVGLDYAFALDGGNSSQLYVEGHDFSGDGGWIDGGGGWHPEGGNRAVPVLIGIQPKN